MPARIAFVCSVLDCGKKHLSRGLCAKHYWRWSVYGDPLIIRRRERGTGGVSCGYIVMTKYGVRKREHVSIAEKALGKKLPPRAVVHHVNGNRSDNRNENLVICPSTKYHHLLHRRTDSMLACGNANWRRCSFCQKYSPPDSMKCNEGNAWHLQCQRAYDKNRRHGRSRRTA